MATAYPKIRELISEDLLYCSDSELEDHLAELGIEAEDLERFSSLLSSVGKRVIKAAPSVLPAAGAAVGTLIAPGLGTALGGAAGQLAGRALGSGSGPHRPARPSASRARNSSAAPRRSAAMRPRSAHLGATGSPAAAQLLQTITNPQTMQALLSMALGRSGRQRKYVAGAAIPVGAFSNLVETLANQASAEYHEVTAASAEIPEYMETELGGLMGDPALNEDRAAALYALLSHESSEHFRPDPRRAANIHEDDDDDLEEQVYFEDDPIDIWDID